MVDRECFKGEIARARTFGLLSDVTALREAGLVRTRIDGPRRLYSLDPAPLAELDEWLKPYREFWARKVAALDDHLKRTD